MYTQAHHDSKLNAPGRGVRPQLTPFNRKLCHLRGLSLRNLNIDPSQRLRRHSSLAVSPSVLHEPGDEKQVSDNDHPKHENTNITTTDRASGRRRRSTLDFNATPRERQVRLENTISYHILDVFFSLHVDSMEEPIYISEQVKCAMNPNFQMFDLSIYDSTVTCQKKLTLKIWAKQHRATEWRCLELLNIYLPALQFLGRTLEHCRKPFPENAVMFHLSDGIYTTLEDPMHKTGVSSGPDSEASGLSSVSTDHTSSYDALVRLQTLHECVQDALQTRLRLTREIENVMQTSNSAGPSTAEIAEVRESLAAASQAVVTATRSTRGLSRQKSALFASISQRRLRIKENCDAQVNDRNCLSAAQTKVNSSQTAHKALWLEISGQRRRICTDLSRIYPLDPTPNKPLLFTIRHLTLPNSTYPATGFRDNVISAALGHVAHLILLLSQYLAVPLPYPIHSIGSTSYIVDPISLMAGSRIFPLHLGRGSVLFRFEYGVFLLNKNIELLSNSLGINVVDIRQTLPNLKYLFFVTTAGKGDMPARKAGGIRGLLRHVGYDEDTPASSRRGSDDSSVDSASIRDHLRRRIGAFNTHFSTTNDEPRLSTASSTLVLDRGQGGEILPDAFSSSTARDHWMQGSRRASKMSLQS